MRAPTSAGLARIRLAVGTSGQQAIGLGQRPHARAHVDCMGSDHPRLLPPYKACRFDVSLDLDSTTILRKMCAAFIYADSAAMQLNWLPPAGITDPYYPYMRAILEAYSVQGDPHLFDTLDDVHHWLSTTLAGRQPGLPPELALATSFLQRMKKDIMYALETNENQSYLLPQERVRAAYLAPLRDLRATVIASFVLAVERLSVGNSFAKAAALRTSLRGTSSDEVDVDSVTEAKHVINHQNP